MQRHERRIATRAERRDQSAPDPKAAAGKFDGALPCRRRRDLSSAMEVDPHGRPLQQHDAKVADSMVGGERSLKIISAGYSAACGVVA